MKRQKNIFCMKALLSRQEEKGCLYFIRQTQGLGRMNTAMWYIRILQTFISGQESCSAMDWGLLFV